MHIYARIPGLMNQINYDILIIGSGAAGLALALTLAEHKRVALMSKDRLLSNSSRYAQGGIAAVISETDSYESHINDTLKTGAGLCHRDVVEYTVKHARDAIEWLIQNGVEFSKDVNDRLHLNREGGHSQRRIVHAADRTGYAVMSTLSEQVLRHHNIDCLIEHTAIDLIVDENRCLGATLLVNNTGEIKSVTAQNTILATGGASTVYLHTTNSDTTSGDGIAMAWRKGATVSNLEFNQFHPTCFYNPGGKTFLISEAMRGEGARLVLSDGTRFMPNYDERAELAPRDIVARAIDHEIKNKNLECVYLNITHHDPDTIKDLFPTIYTHCLSVGIDITKERIPVVPAAHYTCGGIVTNLQGQTSIDKLYAIGEVACTGLHGANRMASNSLLECLVFAANAGEHILGQAKQTSYAQSSDPMHYSNLICSDNIHALKLQLRNAMWKDVGIVRNNARLSRASHLVSELLTRVDELCERYQPTKALIELRNLTQTSELIIRCAQARHESRGLHFNEDYPELSANAEDTRLTPAAVIV